LIVNLADHQVEVYSNPEGSGVAAHYVSRTDCREGEIPVALDGVDVGRLPVPSLVG